MKTRTHAGRPRNPDDPLDPNFKQDLLPVRNENERLERVVKVIEKLIPKLDSVLKTRHKAGGNGNARLSG